LKAYVLIQTQTNDEPVIDSLRAIPGVARAESLKGPYDAIAVTRSGATRHGIEGIMAQIRDVPGVMRALPATSIRPHGQIRRTAQGDEAA
jgi:hypothetical protein